MRGKVNLRGGSLTLKKRGAKNSLDSNGCVMSGRDCRVCGQVVRRYKV